MSDTIKFVYESFKEFLENQENLQEAETSSTAIFGTDDAKDLINQMMDYNSDLGGTNLIEKSDPKTSIGGLKRMAGDLLKKKEYWKAAACNIFWKQSEAGFKNELELFKKIGMTPEELKNPKIPVKVNRFKELIKGIDNEELKDSVIKALKEYPEILSAQVKYPVLWSLVPDLDKAKVYDDFEKLARRKGYDSPEGIAKVIEKEYKKKKSDVRSYLTNPGIKVFLDKTQMKEEEAPIKTKQEQTQMLPVENEHETFKPNMWGANREADYVGENFQKIVDNIGKIFERRKTGEVSKITRITIMTSCDRRRNTGPAEKMSWGTLAFARAVSMASLVVEMAKKVGLQPDEVETINKMIKLDFMGENGDGSSGPNSYVNPGYYVKDGEQSKWVSVKDPSEVVIVPASEDGGLPTKNSGAGAKVEKMKPIKASETEKFNPYRYNNIIMDIEVIDPSSKATENIPSMEQIKDLTYPVQIVLPSRYKSKSASISLPSIKIGRVSGSPGKRPSVSCPTFGGKGKSSLSFGFEFKPVTIASWKSDITKD